MPAFATKLRYRRQDSAPRIEAGLWVRVMARRVEGQLGRDGLFGFVSWNYLFRSAVNLRRTLYSYETPEHGSCKGFSATELEEGAISICRALYGKYQDVNGKTLEVRGDMTKIRFVPGLSAAAKRLLQNLEHTSRRLPGTQETRRLMRFDTHAYRVRYGVPIFVTFSPDESHNLLMVRISRTRRSDPVFANGRDAVGEQFCGRLEPKLGTDLCEDLLLSMPAEELRSIVPERAARQALLARDPLAAVDGFRILVIAAYQLLFGLRVCPFCPDCNNGENGTPCQDIFGSSSTSEGGIFGRIDAGYTSIEAHKSAGSPRAFTALRAMRAPAYATH